MAGPEKNLYKMVKDKLAEFNPIRIETTTINGFPDLILFNKNKQVLFLECKVCDRSVYRTSPDNPCCRPHLEGTNYLVSGRPIRLSGKPIADLMFNCFN